MLDSLFSEFNFSDKNAWKKQAQKELDGKDDKLNNWRITPNLPIEPYYTPEDIDWPEISTLQASQKQTPGWLNLPLIKFDMPWPTNAKIKAALEAGADAVILLLPELELVKSELAKTLHSIRLSDTPIFFQTKINPEKLFQEVSKGAGYYLKGGIFNDPLANWMRSGGDFQLEIETICTVLKKTKMMREFRPFMIESHVFHDAGANPVQELAFLMASTVHYIDKLTDCGISSLHALNRFFYSISVGPDYLSEIAKLRALRFLHAKIGQAYKLPHELCNAFIQTQTSTFYSVAHSPHNNIIRSTSEAMSAVIGGCDALTVLPHDESFTESNEHSQRIARNISLLLSNESYFDQVADPAAGSYHLEIMSRKMAEEAWNLFLEVEEKGGIVACFENNFVQEEIEKSWQQKVGDINSGKVIVGLNKFQSEEKISEMKKYKKKNILASDNDNLNYLPVRNLSGAWPET